MTRPGTRPRTRRSRTAVALAAALALAACASPGNELARQAPESLVGLTRTELLSCAGVPDRTASADGMEYLTYTRSQTLVDYEVEYDDFPWLGPGAPRLLRPRVSPWWERTYTCEATFGVQDGRVRQLRYNDSRDLSLCYRILAACLPKPAGQGEGWRGY